MTDPVPSKEWEGPREGQAYVLWLEGRVTGLRKQVEELSIHAEKWVKRALGGATPEPAAVLFWDTIVGPNVIDSDSDELRITMSFCRREDFERAIAHIGAPPPPSEAPCIHPPEDRAETSDGRRWCAQCGGFI